MSTRRNNCLRLLRPVLVVALCYAFLLQTFFAHAGVAGVAGEAQLMLCHTDAGQDSTPANGDAAPSHCDLCVLPLAHGAVLPGSGPFLVSPVAAGNPDYFSRTDSIAARPPGRAGLARAPPFFA